MTFFGDADLSAEQAFVLELAELADPRARERYAEEADTLSRSLVAFQRAAWHVVEPNTPYIHGWHIECICEHLEAITRGELRNLIINVPPRHEKSLNASVFWPCWMWTTKPETRWLFTSYTQSLSTRDSVKCRRIIQSGWFQHRWGHVFQLTSDQNVKVRFENNRTGVRLATSVEGSATGEGGDVIVADDPHNVREGESTLKREAVLHWWDEVMSTRLNDPMTGAKVIIMQRVHERDLTGHVLAQGGHYEHLCLPARYDPRVQIETGIGWRDPRQREGELLWPDRYPEEAMRELEEALGPYGAAGQLQQRPAPRRGGLFERDDFLLTDRVPPGCVWVRYWDKAGTAGAGKFTAGCLMAMAPDDQPSFYVADMVRGQWAAGDREQRIIATTEGDAQLLGPRGVSIWVEQEPGSGGKESAEYTIANLAGFRVQADRPTGDKFVRAEPFSAATKAGRVHVVRGNWVESFLREMEVAGPGAAYLDQMDAAAGAFNKLNEQRRKRPVTVGPHGMTKQSYWRTGV